MLQLSKRLLNRTYSLIQKKLSGGLCGLLDAPKPLELCPGTFNVFSGWVFDQRGRRINAVEVVQGQKLLGVCDYGLPREDVCQIYPHYPQAEKCGFFGWVFIPHNTENLIRIYGIDEKGRRRVVDTRHPAGRSRVACFFKKNNRLAKNVAGQAQKNSRLPLNIPPKILIAGLAKTGTTALFFKISNSLASCEDIASKTKLLFEPSSYSGLDNQRVLAKIIITDNTPLTIWGENKINSGTHYADFKNFNKKILLQRDPRDRLISTLLYSAQGLVFCSNTKNLEAFLNLLQKKERAPTSVSVCELIEARLRSGNRTLQTWKNALANNLNCFLEFRSHQSNFFYYPYEDFVQGETKALEGFLGFPLSGDAVVEKSLERVVRTKKSGDWQNWFLGEDVNFFKPVFQGFMQELGYEDSWSLPGRQVILPAHASDYVSRISRS